MDGEYVRTCFVIMPFGKKRLSLVRRRPVAGKPATVTKLVDFDGIYERVFKPAIAAVELPEGGRLVPFRADDAFSSGIIDVEMYRYIEYSRFVLADITGLNPNVFFELGHRYRARESGTAVFRLPNAPIPFDINQIRAFSYEYQPEERAAGSREIVGKVLRESLKHNTIDSPIQRALDGQRAASAASETWLVMAENAVRLQDWAAAIQYYERVAKVQFDNGLIQFHIGTCARLLNNWGLAAEHFARSVELMPDFAEGHRELGIALNKIHGRTPDAVSDDGIGSLRRAVQLNGDDFDALASLAGALRRAGDLAGALENYRRAREVSLGHPYPLLNELKLQVVLDGRRDIFSERSFDLERAVTFRQGQCAQMPAIDSPWCFFDLAEAELYLGHSKRFLTVIEEGLRQPLTRAWQARTFRETLELLLSAKPAQSRGFMAALKAGIARLLTAEQQLIT